MGSLAAPRSAPCRTATTRAVAIEKKEWGTKTGAPPEPTPYGRNKATLSAALSLLARPRDGGPAGRDLRPVLYLHVRGRWAGYVGPFL